MSPTTATRGQFREGEVYFRVTFPDARRLYPKIESFVFVGKNVSDEDQEDSWYFQFADSFGRYGSILDGDDGDRRVAVVRREELNDMFDLGQLIGELEAAARRRATKAS